MSRDVLEELVTKFVYDVDQLGLQKYTKAQEKINKNTQKMIGLNSTLAKGLRRLFVGAGAIMGVQGLVKTYRDIDLIRRSIEGLTKSTQDWDYIQKEALRTGTGIESVAKGYRNFYSAASMAGFDKMGIQDMYSDVLTASRAIGATQQQVGGALLALEQMLSKGRVSMEELRRQLGNALPGAFEIGAKAMGVTTQKFNEMVKKGISAAEFVPKFTKELLNTYKEAFPEAIKSLDFALVNLSSSWKLFQYEIMNGSAGQGLAETINSITEFLRSPEAITIAKGIGQALNLVARSLGVIVKHFRILLFLIGINMLSQAPSVISKLTRMVIRFNRELMVTGAVTGGLNKILPTTLMLLKAIGKSTLLLMKNFAGFLVVGAILSTIALALEDIFLYLKDPEALTITKQLVAKSPEFAKVIERIKSGIENFSKIWREDLQPSVERLFDVVTKWAGGEHSTLGRIFEFIIQRCADLLDVLTSILKLFEEIEGKNLAEKLNPFKKEDEQTKQKKFADRFRVNHTLGGATAGAIFGGLVGSAVPIVGTGVGAGVGALIGGLTGAHSANNYLSKNETYSPTINVTNNITGGQNASPQDIANAVNTQLGSIIDNANGVMNFTPWYLRK